MTTTKPLIDPTEVAKAVKVLMADGDVVEVRALKASFNGRYPATISGYFNDQAELVKSVGTLSTASGIYLTVNPVNPALLSRACNRLREAKQDPTTSDHDIARRRWLFIDCDATRPAGISASIAEKKDSGAMARVIRDYLVALGWPDPVLADSGNGWHLLFRIDEPADDDGLVKRFLEALSQRFSDDLTKVDTTVFNPARICKLYGTLAGKGDDTPERPHRLSRICTVPDSIEVVTTEQLTALAGESKPSNGEAKKNSVDAFGRFNLETFIDKHLDARKPTDYRGGKRWVLNKCPFNPDHSRGEACITERADGMLGGMCQHESCTWGWKELRAKFDPTYGKKTTTDTDDDETVMPSPIGIGALVAGHPTLAAPVISGLLRRGETCNVIAAPKVGKSWLAYDGALSTAIGGSWLGKYRCAQGRVLLIDNELHAATLAKRIPVVANALDIPEQDYCRQIDVLPLRGRLLDLHGIDRLLSKVAHGDYSLVILDAWYRAIPAGVSENDNAPVAMLYNLIDQMAERLDCAWMNIHHASKGLQGDKAVTDVGAGAGSQARAADAHIVLRDHEEDGVVVLDAAVRSFAPVEPLALRWDFPCWHPADDVDAGKLKGRLNKQEQQQSQRDQDGIDKITQSLAAGDKTVTKIRDETGVSRERIKRLLGQMSASGYVTCEDTNVANNACQTYHLTRGTAIRSPIPTDDPTT